jgi:hypothetical protein
MLPLSHVDLEWNAPAECPSKEAVLEDAARVLSEPPEAASHVLVHADVTRDERGQWHATLGVDSDDAHSDRVLDAETCQALAKATALILAIAVEGRDEARSVPASAARPSSAPRSRVSVPFESRSQVVVLGSGVVDWGLLPAAAPGAELGLGWADSTLQWRVRAFATASVFGDQTAALASAGNEGGRFAAFATSAHGCASLVRSALDVGLCLGIEFDVMRASGFGPPATGFTSRPRTESWPSALASAIASYSLSRHVAIMVRTQGVLPIDPPTFGIVEASGHGDPLHSPAAGVRVTLGVETRFF